MASSSDPLDQSHGVEEATVFCLADAVNGYDPRVFQAARHFRFDQETFPAFRDFRQTAAEEFDG